ncbi:cytochrome P450 monooxygenase-like protein [Paraphoma chrysanthemicola]|uniref:Cytochrome P450 monooxygenase-like protein n=1 Tax=Paraphoma chrysanthemicola TaxID=798071 RepID=A0A8K0R050_9PLEO|nr:cytochrome P450 monooxygenase-like protein [Paraphoma chrysanthemicola]
MALSIITTTPLSLICLYGAGSGVLSHVAYFIRGEHHRQAPSLLIITITAPLLAITTQLFFTDVGFTAALVRSFAALGSFLGALWVSMVTYRLFFHPLRHFPGPFGAKVSKFWHVKQVFPKLQNHRLLASLQKEYGDFVRTGPNQISVFSPAGVQAIQGVRSKCTKNAWYDMSLPTISLQQVRDKNVHDKRRRIWDHGFAAGSLRVYEDRIMAHASTLLSQLRAQGGNVTSATKWFQLFGFDVMTDIAFGRSFDMTKTGKAHPGLELMEKAMKPIGLLSHIPWLFMLLGYIPGLANDHLKFLSWSGDQVMQRVKMDKEIQERDVMSWLVEAYNKSPQKEADRLLLQGDARLIIVAGSDTTSSTLTYAAYELATNPEIVKALREELSTLGKTMSSISLKDLQSCDYLNAVISETLRLHPPVPSGVMRKTPPEGITVGTTFIPGNTTVVSPTYVVSRSSDAYELADKFLPERWTSRPGLVKDKSAYAPFSLGVYSCIGKQLALMELRIVLFMLVTEFDICFAPGDDGSSFLDNDLDAFTIVIADLKLAFIPREK